MTPKQDVAWRNALIPIAWNGMRLSVPAAWRPARLGLGYLYFEDDDGPVFELKWRRGAGRDGMDAALRALTPKGRATAGGTLPETWLAALADFELMPLSWRLDGRTGLGAALFCPECGMAAVCQGFGGPDGPDAERIAQLAAVLHSLTHHEPGPPVCRIFGLSVTPPPDFSLATFEFLPGRFSLSFTAGRHRLDVLRLAPADVLLTRETLGDLAARLFGFDAAAVQTPEILDGADAVWLASRQGQSGLDALARFFGRQGRLAVMRHEVGVNKLLGVALTASKPVDRDWLAGVAADCVSL
jgi:hypothetical protein